MERETKPVSRISVRRLVEFLLRSGDLDRRVRTGSDLEAALAGAKLHRKLQKAAGPEYEAEVTLETEEEFEDLIISVWGRADGVIREKECVTVDEIKGMYLDVTALTEPYPVHLAQAKCYAAILSERENLPEVHIRMTYANLDTEEIARFDSVWSRDGLQSWLHDLLKEWYRWAKWQMDHIRSRNASMEQLTFPFPYREGQQKLTAAVYRTIRDGKQLFLMAPTGVGKTMSCVYPSVRALGEGHGGRIFYLTAKNETLKVGMEAFSILDERGLDFRTVRITSREKICPMAEASCNPDDCPYAKGHYDRISDAVFDMLQSGGIYDRETILLRAKECMVCPFELTLDLAVWCDAVLGDYNYVFDPNARLQRFFANASKNGCIFLIDEAHNLVERGRDMYSADLVKEHILEARRSLGDAGAKVKKGLTKLNSMFLALKKRVEAEPSGEVLGKLYLLLPLSDAQPFILAALHLVSALSDFYRESTDGKMKESLLEFYFEVMHFLNTAEHLDENYRVCAGETDEGNFSLRLFCVNPAARLTEALEGGVSSILFSATLLPIGYYKSLLTVKEDAYAVYAPSPFDVGKRLLLIGSDVTTRYAVRGREMNERIAEYIYRIAVCKAGNYLAFFPSYKLMREVYGVFRELYGETDVNYVCQMSGMREDDREIFLENFYEDPKDPLVAFAVMGGMFAEGLDLTGTRLIGAVIVGAGIPQVTREREILKHFFDETGGSGFDYAYRFPGINKVEQAAGRVIRTAEDTGVIALLDERFLLAGYRRLFPREWSDAAVTERSGVSDRVSAFWENVRQEKPEA